MSIFFGVTLGLVAVFIAYVLIQLTLPSTYEDSLTTQRMVHADLVKIGRFTERYRKKTGVAPTQEQLAAWMTTQQFSERLIGQNVRILPSDEDCLVGENTALPASDHTYRLCYWNNWTEEYAPQTEDHTFATSIDDYLPSWWKMTILFAAILGICAFAFHMIRGPKKRSV